MGINLALHSYLFVDLIRGFNTIFHNSIDLKDLIGFSNKHSCNPLHLPGMHHMIIKVHAGATL